MLWGLLSVIRGAVYLARTPATWPRALVPVLVFFLLFAGGLALSLGLLRPGVLSWLGANAETPLSGWRSFGNEALAWLATLVAGAASAIIALLLAPPLASPALEGIVALRERSLDVPERGPSSFWQELLCGLRAQLFGALVLGPVLLLTWIGGLLAPAAAPVLVPLSLLGAAFGVAWGLLDYPLTLRGVGARERFRFLRRHARVCLGFGAGFALVFWVPCLSLLLLPVGVVGATEVVWHLAALDPEAPRSLRRAASGAPGARGILGASATGTTSVR